jgi:hypothetical protein
MAGHFSPPNSQLLITPLSMYMHISLPVIPDVVVTCPAVKVPLIGEYATNMATIRRDSAVQWCYLLVK